MKPLQKPREDADSPPGENARVHDRAVNDHEIPTLLSHVIDVTSPALESRRRSFRCEPRADLGNLARERVALREDFAPLAQLQDLLERVASHLDLLILANQQHVLAFGEGHLLCKGRPGAVCAETATREYDAERSRIESGKGRTSVAKVRVSSRISPGSLRPPNRRRWPSARSTTSAADASM